MGFWRILFAILLVIFNVLLWVIAGILLYVAADFFIASRTYDIFLNTTSAVYIVVPVIVIGLCGVLLIVLGFLGIIGAVCANSSILLTYNILLIIVLVVQIIGGILAVVFRSDIYEQMGFAMLANMDQYQYQSDDAITEAIDNIQQSLLCCGAYGPDDWKDVSWINNKYDNAITPLSCCGDNSTSSYDFCIQYSDIYQVGCVELFFNTVEMWGAILISVAILLALFEITGVVLSYCVMCLRSRETQDIYVEV
ncbi:Tetraspanin-3 [Oopsacas minuta]|uniref:Tetraspanin n=1 Tax=Oopsacas minuta TaxID=111878 RepID=A0AAV7K0I8_9METZ|nr:Tetraspanin-3 [Oopsacas minuta]